MILITYIGSYQEYNLNILRPSIIRRTIDILTLMYFSINIYILRFNKILRHFLPNELLIIYISNIKKII